MVRTNADRRHDARQALHFGGYTTPGEPLEDIVGDLLSDLRHLAAYHGIDFDRLLERSQRNFEAELREES